MRINGRVMCFLFMLLLPKLCPSGPAKTIYVDDDAIGANDGTSWVDAYVFLQEALADARGAEKPVEIHVARGTYRPNEGLIAIPEFDWRTFTFQLISGVTLKGGYAGLGGSDPNERDIKLYETVLSGDLNGDDVNLTDPHGLLDAPGRTDNSYHVITGSGTDATAVLDGFTVTAGNADADGPPPYDQGGGMYNDSGNPTLAHCIFTENRGRVGGGMYNENNSSPNLIDCTFSENYVNMDGGGMYNEESRPTLTNCIFSGNHAYDGGGGIYNSQSNAILNNCTLVGNSAVDIGGVYHSSDGRSTLTGCIIWSNTLPQVAGNAGISYSDIQGGWDGQGNIDVDPLFADPDNGDYHLKSKAGRWDPVSESWIVDDISSPCIDAGDPNRPVAFEPFPNGGLVNMGAYGGTAQASKSPSSLHAKYGGGTGEPNNPFLIYTPEQMNTIGLYAEDRDSHFKLMADVDLGGFEPRGFNIIGIYPNSFRGVFDGNSRTISNFTYISNEVDGVALFGTVEGARAEIRDLGLINPFIDAGRSHPIIEEGRVEANQAASLVHYLWSGAINRCTVRGGSVSADIQIGGLVAYNQGGTILNCSSTANVSGINEIGGLVGSNGGTIIGCHAMGKVTGEEIVGGLVGHNEGTIRESGAIGDVIGDETVGGLAGSSRLGIIKNSYSSGVVAGVDAVGGLVGKSHGDITCCYSTCEVSGDVFVGGLVGLFGSYTIDRCYSTGNVVHVPIEGRENHLRIGGLVGFGYSLEDKPSLPSEIHRSFWDIETSGQIFSFGGIGLPTTEMQTAGTFLETGWDFMNETENGTDDIWWIDEGRDYPRLWWELFD